jgi:ribosomal protein S18 acetylase RimI-like enzyme
MITNDKLIVRRAEPTDVSGLVELNREAYPDLILDNVVYNEKQLRAHLERFPMGQLVAEKGGQLVGAISTLIPDRRIDPLAAHTWEGITDGGYFSRHDPNGRTLYLADIYVSPQFQGQRVGTALYLAVADLCRTLKLAHVVAGGRLWGYSEVADRMRAHDYVAEVVAGRIHDRVLSSQLRAGFVVRGLLAGYLHDWRSRHWATLLEWHNPQFQLEGARVQTPTPTTEKPMSVFTRVVE